MLPFQKMAPTWDKWFISVWLPISNRTHDDLGKQTPGMNIADSEFRQIASARKSDLDANRMGQIGARIEF
jgi:hypothetical protein